MKLNQLAAKPQLIVITLDDEDIIKEFTEPLEFYTWDRQPLETFMKLATKGTQDPAQLIEMAHTMILDEKGEPVVKDGLVLPTTVLMKAIQKIVEHLGK